MYIVGQELGDRNQLTEMDGDGKSKDAVANSRLYDTTDEVRLFSLYGSDRIHYHVLWLEKHSVE